MKLLLVSYYFPPCHTVGAYRPFYMAKYLTRLGWEVSVLTPDPSLLVKKEPLDEWRGKIDDIGLEIIETGHNWRGLDNSYFGDSENFLVRLFNKGARYLSTKLLFDRAAGWHFAALKACRHLKKGDYDIILASAPPNTSFPLARSLSKRLDCPFIMDYRDLWCGNPYLKNYPIYIRWLERSIVKASASILCALHTMPETLEELYGVSAKVVTNGFDPDDYLDLEDYSFEDLAIVYTGNFYPPNRSISPFFAAVSRAGERCPQLKNRLKFHYFGMQTEYVKSEAVKYNVENQVVLHGLVPRRTVLSAIKNADLVLVVSAVFQNQGVSVKADIPGKIYEPLGSGTPVLLIASEDSVPAKIVKETNSGFAFTGDDIEGLTNFLCEYPDNHRKDSNHAEQYSWSFISQELDETLKETIKKWRQKKPI